MNTDLLFSHLDLMMAWFFGLIFTAVMAGMAGLFPKKLESLRKIAVLVLIFPGIAVSLIYAIQGFVTLDRPIVHWVFSKNAHEALRLGLVFDLLSFSVSVFFGLVVILVGLQNRLSIRMSSALSLSWLAVGLAASAQTLWLAVLGIGIQLFSRILPLVESEEDLEASDASWIAPSLRAWIALLCLLAGGAGLTAQGASLDFFTEGSKIFAEETGATILSSALLIFGLLLLATPVFASHTLFRGRKNKMEEDVFISEASLSWISVIVIYRLLNSLHDTPWIYVIGIGAAIATVGSLVSLLFQTTRESAIHLWLATLPLSTLMTLPFVSAREAHLGIIGMSIAFSGLWVSLDHSRTRLDTSIAGAFFLGATGFFGWSTASVFSAYFSRIESEPILRGGVFGILLLFASIGWRLVLRGGIREERISPALKGIVLGIFFIIGFGPLLSGRWGGGGIPGEGDWIDGAKNWAWVYVERGAEESLDWFGFGISQFLIFLSILIGTFAWKQSDLFPFHEKYPRTAKKVEGLFGLLWVNSILYSGIKKMGVFLVSSVSDPSWEKGIPKSVNFVIEKLSTIGKRSEEITNEITSNKYSRLFTPAAKFVQWMHGGNVRLYAWFTLIWVLIFSIYLNR